MLAYSSPFDFSVPVSFVEGTLAVHIKHCLAEQNVALGLRR